MNKDFDPCELKDKADSRNLVMISLFFFLFPKSFDVELQTLQLAANKAYSEFGGWCDTDLAAAIQITLQGFEDEDAEAAKEGLNKPAIKNLDIEFARMATKDIPLPDTGSLEAAASQFGAQRAEATVPQKENIAVVEEPIPSPKDPVIEEQKQLEEEEDE